MMKRKGLSLFALLLVICLGLSGCSSSGSQSTSSDGSGKKQTLVVWTFFDQVKLLAKQFEKSHPNVDVQVKVFPGDQYKTKLQTALQTKTNVPDVFDLERGYISSFINTPFVADLSDMGGDKLVKDMVPYVADLGKDDDGHVKAVADSSSPIGLWYHRKAAKKWLGTDDPDKISAMINSWDKIITLGKKVYKESNGKVHLLDSTGSIYDMEKYQMQPWVKNNVFQIDSKWNDVLNTMRTVRQENVDAKLAGSSPGWGSALNNYDPAGKAIMFGVPSWATMDVDTKDGKADGQFGVAKAPVGSYDGGTYRAIYANTSKKKLAYEFVQFDASEKWQNYNLKNTGNMPSLLSVYDQNADSYTPPMYGDQKVLNMYKDISEQIPAAPAGKYTADINSTFGGIVTDMLNKGKSNQWAFDQLKEKVKESYPEFKFK
ncbi:hypothetical protein GCM10007096_00550 [Pullulanibacillus pueri]|uniref:Uncharacterized protein n=2 Tax=Pullulanibacillus pueri TaxID=1437324 RepID=A0A8J2ZQJ5_9BACL|nr:hypothetical protein GCM10007096_00550 [Pullulanibacillus pueri]